MTHIIYNIHKKLAGLAMIAALLIVATSCEHKDLYVRQVQKQLVKIHFDWDNLLDGDEKPETVTLYFYNDEDGQMYKYDVPTNDDDYIIEINSGLYDLITYSTDDPNILGRNTDDIDDHEILALELNKDVPTVYGENGEVEIEYYNDETDPDHEMQVITITPKPVYSRYNVYVKNTNLVDGATTWMASLSGLTNCIYAQDYDCSDNASESVISFPLYTQENTTCTGNITTFGQLDTKENPDAPNKLLITIYTDDKHVVYYLFDVTKQISKAKDPHNVDIIVDLADAEPLKPGDPDYPGDPNDGNKQDEGGLDADVDDFDDENIDIEV